MIRHFAVFRSWIDCFGNFIHDLLQLLLGEIRLLQLLDHFVQSALGSLRLAVFELLGQILAHLLHLLLKLLQRFRHVPHFFQIGCGRLKVFEDEIGFVFR